MQAEQVVKKFIESGDPAWLLDKDQTDNHNEHFANTILDFVEAVGDTTDVYLMARHPNRIYLVNRDKVGTFKPTTVKGE